MAGHQRGVAPSYLHCWPTLHSGRGGVCGGRRDRRAAANDRDRQVHDACCRLPVSAHAEWSGLLGLELVVGPDVAFGQQVGDKDGSDAVVFADDDLEGGEVVKKDLTAPAARGNNTSVAVAHGDDCVQLVGTLCGCRADEYQLSAGASREVEGVHRGDDPAVLGAGCGCHGVVVAPAASASHVSRGLDEFVVDVLGLHGHLLCLRRVSSDVDPRDEGAQANIGGVLVPPDDVAVPARHHSLQTANQQQLTSPLTSTETPHHRLSPPPTPNREIALVCQRLEVLFLQGLGEPGKLFKDLTSATCDGLGSRPVSAGSPLSNLGEDTD